jgi:hypothetical protein
MSLNFNYYGKEDTTTWTKEDWKLYNVLIWSTMACDIGKLTEENIYEFVRRFNINNTYDQVYELKDGTRHYCRLQIEVKDIKKFIGLGTNVITLTANQWALKHFGKKASQFRVADMKREDEEANQEVASN